MSDEKLTYTDMVFALVKPGAEIQKHITPEQLNVIHMLMGICGEAGELLDAIKKHVMYNKPLDLENVVEELGDIEFYMEGMRQALGIDRQDTLDYNKKKLLKRYASGTYSDKQAQERADKA